MPGDFLNKKANHFFLGLSFLFFIFIFYSFSLQFSGIFLNDYFYTHQNQPVLNYLSSFYGGSIVEFLPDSVQEDSISCGVAVVFYIFQKNQIYLSQKEIKKRTQFKKNLSFLQMKKIFEKNGFFVTGQRLENLPSQIDPLSHSYFIAHLSYEDSGHFVLIEKKENDQLSIFDPALGKVMVEEKKFLPYWTGNVLWVKKQ